MGTLDALIGSAFGTIFGTGYVLGAAIFIFFAYVAFKSGMSTSALAFMGVLLLGFTTLLGYTDPVIYGIVLVVGGFFFWRMTMQVSG